MQFLALDRNNHYLFNGEILVSNPEYDYESDTMASWTFDNVPLVRGNLNGQFNHFINKLEYK